MRGGAYLKLPFDEHRLKKTIAYVGIACVVLFAAVFFGRVAWLAFNEAFWADVGKKHFAAVVGLPAAALASFLLVVVLETAAGHIELRVLGFEFKGASGPIVMWVLCFLAVAFAIWLLWDKTFVV